MKNILLALTLSTLTLSASFAESNIKDIKYDPSKWTNPTGTSGFYHYGGRDLDVGNSESEIKYDPSKWTNPTGTSGFYPYGGRDLDIDNQS
jgi:hypothetical protein